MPQNVVKYIFSISILTFTFFYISSCREGNSDGVIESVEGGGQQANLPNILIVLADDLNVSDLSCYGGKNVNTPNIDKLAKEGMRFTNCFTSSAMCTPCRTSLYTGLYPVKNGAHRNSQLGIIKPGVESIAHHLKKIGYRVGLAGKKHINPLSQFDFEIVPGFTDNTVGPKADYNTQEIAPFMTKNRSQPYCLVIASTLPHAPWTVGDRTQFDQNSFVLPENWFDTAETRQRYRDYLAEVSALDKQVGDILNMLGLLNQEQNTLVLFLGEQGAQFPGNKWTLWNPGIHTAMIARFPESIKAGVIANQLVQYVDVIPTIFDFVNKEIPKDLDGSSFSEILKGDSVGEIRKYGYAIHSNIGEGDSYSIRSVFNKEYKMLWNLNHEDPYFNQYIMKAGEFISWKKAAENSELAGSLVSRYENRPEFEMYNVTTDPYEMVNLAYLQEYQQLRENMKSEIEAWMKIQGDPGSSIDK